jgi:hypothetical protein
LPLTKQGAKKFLHYCVEGESESANLRVFRMLMQASGMDVLTGPYVYHHVHAIEVPRQAPRTCFMPGKSLVFTDIPVEFRHRLGFCEPREHPYSNPLRQIATFIPHDLHQSGVHPEHRHAVYDIDEF